MGGRHRAELEGQMHYGHPPSNTFRVQSPLQSPAVLGRFSGACSLPQPGAVRVSFYPGETLPVSGILARYLRRLITPRAFQCQRDATRRVACAAHMLMKSQLRLQHQRSDQVLQTQARMPSWLSLKRSQKWVRWLNRCCGSGPQLPALDFLILTLHKHYFSAFIYTQV